MKPLLNQQELYQVTCTLVRETPIGTHVWRVSEWMPMVTPSGYIDQVAEFHLQLNGRVYISTLSHSHVQRVRHHHERFPLDATSAPVQMRKNLHLQTGRKKDIRSAKDVQIIAANIIVTGPILRVATKHTTYYTVEIKKKGSSAPAKSSM